MNISSLGVTPVTRLKNLMKKLRNPKTGCPWDREQSFATIAPYTIEEAYEVADAIEREHMGDLKEELGDLMFQVIFHAQIADEKGFFDFDDICDGLTEKMIRRHPHVFKSDEGTQNSTHHSGAWEAMKTKERAAKLAQSGQPVSLLSDIPIGLPALTRAEKLQKRAARVGFDWPNLDGVIDKISEEARELAVAHHTMNNDAIEDEMGDLLFAVTNLARKLDVDPETALRRTNKKFCDRFGYIEQQAIQNKTPIEKLSLDQMESHWQAAKGQ